MKHSPKSKRLTHPPREPWVWATKRLLESPAWRCMTGTDHKVLSRILIEHSANAGLCNGKLKVPYGDFERYGVRRKSVRESLLRISALGIIKRTYEGRKVYGGAKGEAAEYAVTWYGTTTENNNPVPATNDWQRYPTIEAAEKAIGVAMDRLKKERTKARRQTQKPIFLVAKTPLGTKLSPGKPLIQNLIPLGAKPPLLLISPCLPTHWHSHGRMTTTPISTSAWPSTSLRAWLISRPRLLTVSR